MSLAITSVLFACLCWGLIFVVPSFIYGFNPIEIALGRFFFYGLLSFVWLLFNKRYLLSRSYIKAWKKAVWLGLISTIVCYTGMVFGMRFANPAVTALIYAMSPITIALVGNYRKKEFVFGRLFIPSILMAVGVVLANLQAFHYSSKSPGEYILGLICGIMGLAAWTWYTVDNSHFLSNQPQMKVNDWSLMMGSATFVLVVFIGSFFVLLDQDMSKFFVFDLKMQTFLIASLVMGTISTWLAFFFWNLGMKKLPISLAGQLMVFEVIFGLILIYFVENRLPLFMEAMGIVFMLIGVISGCKILTKASVATPST